MRALNDVIILLTIFVSGVFLGFYLAGDIQPKQQCPKISSAMEDELAIYADKMYYQYIMDMNTQPKLKALRD